VLAAKISGQMAPRGSIEPSRSVDSRTGVAEMLVAKVLAAHCAAQVSAPEACTADMSALGRHGEALAAKVLAAADVLLRTEMRSAEVGRGSPETTPMAAAEMSRSTTHMAAAESSHMSTAEVGAAPAHVTATEVTAATAHVAATMPTAAVPTAAVPGEGRAANT
jgi:hypothetical protein